MDSHVPSGHVRILLSPPVAGGDDLVEGDDPRRSSPSCPRTPGHPVLVYSPSGGRDVSAQECRRVPGLIRLLLLLVSASAHTNTRGSIIGGKIK